MPKPKYRDAVNAPLSPETVRALNERFRVGDVPRRKMRRPRPTETRQSKSGSFAQFVAAIVIAAVLGTAAYLLAGSMPGLLLVLGATAVGAVANVAVAVYSSRREARS